MLCDNFRPVNLKITPKFLDPTLIIIYLISSFLCTYVLCSVNDTTGHRSKEVTALYRYALLRIVLFVYMALSANTRTHFYDYVENIRNSQTPIPLSMNLSMYDALVDFDETFLITLL